MSAPMETRRALVSLRANVSRLAEELFRVDTEPDLTLLKDPSALRGRTAQLVHEAHADVQRVWERYVLVKDASEALDQAVADDHDDDARRFLGADAIALPDGRSTSIGDLADALLVELSGAIDALGRVAAAWRDVVPRLDAASSRLTDIGARAAAIGVGRDPALRQPRRLLAQLQATAASDPLSVDPTAVEHAVDHAEAIVLDLQRRHDSLPTDLGAARTILEELDHVIPEGRRARDAAMTKVFRPTGLLEPVDAAAMNAGEQGLRPWLDRIFAQADAGGWLPASHGLAQWRRVADGWMANARRVLAANAAPVVRRNELRGLLTAYQSKAAATGLAEDTNLADLYRQAYEALHTAPCDVDSADRLVHRYGNAVNDPDVAT